MCGIAGIVSQKPMAASELAALCLRFSAGMQHRGPDDEGFVCINEEGELHFFRGDDSASAALTHIREAQGEFVAALVHRRLSIIGPGPQGAQPMLSPSGRYVIVFNGECFNFKNLNQKYGFDTPTHTDTEVVLHLLDMHGVRGLQHIEGFFAGIVYDKTQQCFHVFRDPTGVKPLYTCKRKGVQLFCSETQALRKLAEIDTVSPKMFLHFFSEGLLDIGDNSTFFSGIYTFPKGICETITTGGKEDTRFELEKLGEPPVALLQRLEASIEQRITADVPLGFAVSGGVDSALILGMARHLHPERELHAFSVVSGHSAADESAWQQQVVDYNKAIWHTTDITQQGSQLLQEVVQHTDLPPVAWNNVAHYALCKLVKQAGITVILNGQGADEIFGGYPDYLARPLKKGKLKPGQWPISSKERLKMRATLFAQQRLPMAIQQRIFSKKYADILHDDFIGYQSVLWEKSKLDAEAKMWDDYYGIKLGQMLLWEDRNGMAHSLESRNPFADDRNLASFLKLPLSTKLKNGYTKGILREAGKGLVPESVLWRVDKKGFSVPDAQLTQSHISAWKEAFFDTSLEMWAPLAKREKLFSKLENAAPADLQAYFRLVSFSYFLQHIQNGKK
jgi:asparagine synthase (glutamine-hydrolysing)